MGVTVDGSMKATGTVSYCCRQKARCVRREPESSSKACEMWYAVAIWHMLGCSIPRTILTALPVSLDNITLFVIRSVPPEYTLLSFAGYTVVTLFTSNFLSQQNQNTKNIQKYKYWNKVCSSGCRGILDLFIGLFWLRLLTFQFCDWSV